MKAKYPNLELIEYKFKEFIFKNADDILNNTCFHKYRADVFMQTWSTTATGFNLENYASGQAFTDEYTTVIEMNWCIRTNGKEKHFEDCEDVIFGIFFGNTLAYVLLNPNKKFYEDLKNRDMLPQREAAETYKTIEDNAK